MKTMQNEVAIWCIFFLTYTHRFLQDFIITNCAGFFFFFKEIQQNYIWTMKPVNFSALQVSEILSYLGQYGPLHSFFKEKQPPESSFVKILSLLLKTILPQLKLIDSRKILEQKSLCYKTIEGHWTLRVRFLSWGNVLLSEFSSFSPLGVYFSLHLSLHSSEGN